MVFILEKIYIQDLYMVYLNSMSNYINITYLVL